MASGELDERIVITRLLSLKKIPEKELLSSAEEIVSLMYELCTKYRKLLSANVPTAALELLKVFTQSESILRKPSLRQLQDSVKLTLKTNADLLLTFTTANVSQTEA